MVVGRGVPTSDVGKAVFLRPIVQKPESSPPRLRQVLRDQTTFHSEALLQPALALSYKARAVDPSDRLSEPNPVAAHLIMSTREEAFATRDRLSEYHVYHEGEENLCITPFLDKTKEFGYNRKRCESAAAGYAVNHKETEENSSFVHRPVLFFHDPPRTLRRGS